MIFLQMTGIRKYLQLVSIIVFFDIVHCHRIHLSDSILDIINTQHVEQILAERRMNQSRINDAKRLISQNDVDDEDVTESDPDIYHTSDVVDFEYNTNKPARNQASMNRNRNDYIMHYNDSIAASRFPNANANFLADLQAYRGDKILKSSKNALLIAKKELLKLDWCKTESFEQKIREEGCYSKKITNNFCYGQCNSFYIPKSPKRRRKQNFRNSKRDQMQQQQQNVDAFRSCAFCKPSETIWKSVTLRCPSLTPNYRRKRIQIVKECKCIAQPLN